MKSIVMFCALFFLFLSCTPENDEVLSVEAKYVLPYPVGREYICSQEFNDPYSHNGTFRYAVDFAMPIGTLITTARRGHVVYILESYSDYDQTAGHENVVIVIHEDSTYARYVHLTTNGALVKIGQAVIPGDTIGMSGNSGSGGPPHLHFDVTNTNNGRSDQTIPFDFKNTIQHPIGLIEGVSYKALPY
ncbi:MAG: M23 family metallopeptidase [Ignavibacteriales bacterium]|nr:M23 family metallopeptidase [Ignavibacteriales bacterium]